MTNPTGQVNKRLATPTDLTPKEVQAITNVINPLVADHYALYVKTKNFHWHLSGSHFNDYHVLFDGQATQILDTVDILAERVRKIGATTIRSLGQIIQLTRIKDDNDDMVLPGDMCNRLMLDNQALTTNMRVAHVICGNNRDSATTSILEILMDESERRTWFLYEIYIGYLASKTANS